jgi:hypothetical protein
MNYSLTTAEYWFLEFIGVFQPATEEYLNGFEIVINERWGQPRLK